MTGWLIRAARPGKVQSEDADAGRLQLRHAEVLVERRSSFVGATDMQVHASRAVGPQGREQRLDQLASEAAALQAG